MKQPIVDIEKGHTNVGLIRKQIIDKNGHTKTVYVRTHEDGAEHHFAIGHKVIFEHNGNNVEGDITGMKYHEKYDKFGTATIQDKEGNKYSKSLRQVENHPSVDTKVDTKRDDSEKLSFVLDKLKTQSKENGGNYWDGGACGTLALTVSKVLPNVTFYHSESQDHVMWSNDGGKTLYDGDGVPLKKPKDVREVWEYKVGGKNDYVDFKSKGGKTEDEAGVLAWVDEDLLNLLENKQPVEAKKTAVEDKPAVKIFDRPDMENPVYSVDFAGQQKFIQRQDGMNPGDTAWYEVTHSEHPKKKDVKIWETVKRAGADRSQYFHNIGYNKQEAIEAIVKKYPKEQEALSDDEKIEQERERLNKEVDKFSDELNRPEFKQGRSAGGLTPDEIKNSDVFKVAKQNYNKAFKELRDFNQKNKPKHRGYNFKKAEMNDVNEQSGYKFYDQKNLGVERKDMPQIDEDSIDEFLIHFAGKVKVSKLKMALSKIKPTQCHIKEDKVIDMIANEHDWKSRKYIISSDNYLLDGHHSYAMGLEFEPDAEVTVYRVNLKMKDLLRRSKKLKLVNKVDLNDNIVKAEDIQMLFNTGRKVLTYMALEEQLQDVHDEFGFDKAIPDGFVKVVLFEKGVRYDLVAELQSPEHPELNKLPDFSKSIVFQNSAEFKQETKDIVRRFLLTKGEDDDLSKADWYKTKNFDTTGTIGIKYNGKIVERKIKSYEKEVAFQKAKEQHETNEAANRSYLISKIISSVTPDGDVANLGGFNVGEAISFVNLGNIMKGNIVGFKTIKIPREHEIAFIKSEDGQLFQRSITKIKQL